MYHSRTEAAQLLITRKADIQILKDRYLATIQLFLKRHVFVIYRSNKSYNHQCNF